MQKWGKNCPKIWNFEEPRFLSESSQIHIHTPITKFMLLRKVQASASSYLLFLLSQPVLEVLVELLHNNLLVFQQPLSQEVVMRATMTGMIVM